MQHRTLSSAQQTDSKETLVYPKQTQETPTHTANEHDLSTFWKVGGHIEPVFEARRPEHLIQSRNLDSHVDYLNYSDEQQLDRFLAGSLKVIIKRFHEICETA